jgi:hypothetical protein|tara:strand:- start:214 stop:408 length:195 start_codon:yes stop_codon:yes gene_type:complete
MKYIVIILLLSTSGVERIELKTNESNCGEIAKAWREVNTTYQGPGPNQGNFTNKGKLMIGYICD